MKTSQHVASLVSLLFLIAPLSAQSPTASRRSRPAPTQVIVRDVSGTPLEGVRVTISGSPTTVATDAQGLATVTLADGSHRLRLEREGFITLERDVSIRNVRPVEVIVALNRAPRPPEPPAAPEPAPPTVPVPVATAGIVGPPATVSIPAFLDKNFIGRDPLKESILGCMPDATARLLQLREAVAAHTHSDLDEILYVVAGDGAVRIGDNVITLTPGSMSAIPRGTRHAIERRGKNPLIVLSTLAGAPCPTASNRAGTR